MNHQKFMQVISIAVWQPIIVVIFTTFGITILPVNSIGTEKDTDIRQTISATVRSQAAY